MPGSRGSGPQPGRGDPKDPYPVRDGVGGPVPVAPVFLLYDYSFLSSRQAWRHPRVVVTDARHVACAPKLPVMFDNHHPLIREPTRTLRRPEFPQWCGTGRTADSHVRFGATAVVCGRLHIPRTTRHYGVRFEEESLGYPREWRPPNATPKRLRRALPEQDAA